VPWHYSGDLLTVEYRTDPGAIRSLLPDGVTLAHDDEDPGAVAFIWADWQSCGADGAELLDPIRSQYREAFVVVRCRYREELYSRCLFIWVDKDFALVRGHLQGYPKKMGSIHQTRPITRGQSRTPPRSRGGLRHDPRGQRSPPRPGNGHAGAARRETSGFVNGHAMLHHRWFPGIELDGRDSLAEVVTMSGVTWTSVRRTRATPRSSSSTRPARN
jgi:acetoacetate decarboxylase